MALIDNGDDPRIPTDEEIERALRRAWFPVARTGDLTEPRRVRLLGETLAVFLDADGTPRATADRCPHRGASLADGHVEGDRIVCPYHGWQWRGEDGRCAHIPSLGAQGAIPPRAVVAAHRTAERWGLVWCCLEEPALPLPAPAALEDIDWTYAPAEPLPVAAGMRSAVENFRDVAHFPFVHRSTMGHLPPQIEPFEVELSGTEVRMTREYSAIGGDAGMWEERMTFSYHAIAPAFVCLRMDHERGARLLLNAPSPRTAPTDPGRPETTIFWVEGITSDYTDMTLDEVLAAEALVFQEDNPILERLEPGEAPLDPSAQVHTAADAYTLAYRRAFAEFVRRTNAGQPTGAAAT